MHAGEILDAMHEYRISPKPPFSFERTAALLSPGPEDPIDVFDGKRYTRLLDLDGRMRLALVSSLGAEQRPELIITLMNGTEQDERPIGRVLNRMLGMDFDLGPFYEMCRTDQELFGLSRDHYGLKPPQRLRPFEALALAIASERASHHYFRASLSSLAEAHSYSVAYAGHSFCSFPTPSLLAERSVDDLSATGLTATRAENLRDVASEVARGALDLKALGRKPIEVLLETLQELRGVGRQGAQLTALVGYGRLDCFPSGDPSLRRWVARNACGTDDVDEATADAWAEQWGPLRGVVACYVYSDLMKSGEL